MAKNFCSNEAGAFEIPIHRSGHPKPARTATCILTTSLMELMWLSRAQSGGLHHDHALVLIISITFLRIVIREQLQKALYRVL